MTFAVFNAGAFTPLDVGKSPDSSRQEAETHEHTPDDHTR